MSLQVQGVESRKKPWHDYTLRLDLVLCLGMRSIAELDVVSERAHEAEHAKPLT